MDTQKIALANTQDTEFRNTVGRLLIKAGQLIKILAKAIWEILQKVGKGLVNLFRTAPGEYITFIIFIIILLTGIMFLAFSPDSPFRSGGGGGGGGGGATGGTGVGGAITNYLANLNVDTSWLYRFRGKNGDAYNAKARSTLSDGRCDGVSNIDVSNSSTSGKMCLNAKLPTTIEWNLDPTQMPEWKQLPPRIQARLAKAKNGTKVFIPWGIAENAADANNPFAKLQKQINTLVPQCSKAYYGDGTSAAHLFRTDDETNMSCRLAVVENKPYGKRNIPYDDERPGSKTPVNRGEGKTCTL